MFEKNLNIGYLLDFYGDVLSERRRDALDFYYNDDMSLSEIAEEMGISRQGVRDLIKKAEEELLFYEEKLGLAKKFADAQEHAKRALELCREYDIGDDLTLKVEPMIQTNYAYWEQGTGNGYGSGDGDGYGNGYGSNYGISMKLKF